MTLAGELERRACQGKQQERGEGGEEDGAAHVHRTALPAVFFP